jgi:DNA-binding transcriptional MerR regulator
LGCGHLRLLGFTLDEIRELFFSFRQDTRASARWQKLSQAKLAQLAQLEEEIATVRRLLHRLREHCDCETLDQCGRRLRQKAGVPVPCKSAPKQRAKGRNSRQGET